MQNLQVLLTFDLEEFDIPLEYGLQIDWEEQIEVGKTGMNTLSDLLDFHKINTTLFTTATYAVHNKPQLSCLSNSHEIASHSYYHSSFQEKDLINSKLVLEEITNKKVTGLRMPRMKQVSMEAVRKAGYLYDASVNPTYIPGKYNNFNLPLKPYKENNVYRVPCSVFSALRFPLFWLAFKNISYALYKQLAIQTLKKTGILHLYFHPWEFADISQYKLPIYIKRHSGRALVERLDCLINDLKKEASFSTINNFLADQTHF